MAIHSVAEVTRYIRDLLQNESLLQGLLIRGEISNFKCYSSGHCYFTLKDKESCLKCVMFRSRAQGLRFQPENGMQVIARGNIAVFERDGVYQLYVDSLTPEGTGNLAMAFEQLKQRLLQEGLFEESHKQPLPVFPSTIGIVTSLSGAVLRDIYHVSKQRNPRVKLVLYPVQVQGEGAAEEISKGIYFFNKKYPVDVLIVGRGGGSMEDLWAFNEEIVVRTVYASKIPIISAVGHETDFTLSDFAADRRAATPSHAAELAVPDTLELQHRVAVLQVRIRNAVIQNLRKKREQLLRCQKSTLLQRPQQLLAERRQRMEMLLFRMEQQKEQLLQQKKHRLTLCLERLDLLNPARVLRRGYGIVENEQGLIRSVKQAPEGSQISVLLADGKLLATVDGKDGEANAKKKRAEL